MEQDPRITEALRALFVADDTVRVAYDVMSGHPCFTYEDGLVGMRKALNAVVDTLAVVPETSERNP